MLFAVILTLYSARMLPKFYNLRSKRNDFLLGLLFLSFHQHATACQSWWCRAEQEWGEKTDKRILFWEK